MTNTYNWSHRKLTFEQAEEIRRTYESTKLSHRKLAALYNVGATTVRFILNNQRYNNSVPPSQKVRK